jgi:hypothetical protein
MTILNPGSDGPQVGEISTIGSAKAAIIAILTAPKIIKVDIATINANFFR